MNGVERSRRNRAAEHRYALFAGIFRQIERRDTWQEAFPPGLPEFNSGSGTHQYPIEIENQLGKVPQSLRGGL